MRSLNRVIKRCHRNDCQCGYRSPIRKMYSFIISRYVDKLVVFKGKRFTDDRPQSQDTHSGCATIKGDGNLKLDKREPEAHFCRQYRCGATTSPSI